LSNKVNGLRDVATQKLRELTAAAPPSARTTSGSLPQAVGRVSAVTERQTISEFLSSKGTVALGPTEEGVMNSAQAKPTLTTAAISTQAFRLVGLAGLALSGVVAMHARQASLADVTGEWRSSEQFESQPRATLVVREDGRLLAGSLTLLGMTRGGDERATVRMPFREGKWNGTNLAFETALPDDEGKARWVFRVTALGKGTLQATTEDGQRDADGPSWEMSRQ
jgi:hypothetical protein